MRFVCQWLRRSCVPRKPEEICFDACTKGDVLLVEWIDAMVATGWTAMSDLKKKKPDIRCRSVGFFLFKTDEFVCMASSAGAKSVKEVNGVIYIPLDWCQKITRLPSS